MSQCSSQQQFEIIFEGPTDYSEDTLRKLRGVFISELEFSIEETIRALNQFPISIAKSSVEEEASKLSQILEHAGGKVLLVRPVSTPHYSEPHRSEAPKFNLAIEGQDNSALEIDLTPSNKEEPSQALEAPTLELADIRLELDAASPTFETKPELAAEPKLNLNELTISFDEPTIKLEAKAKDDETKVAASTTAIQLSEPTRNSKITAFQINYDERHTLATPGPVEGRSLSKREFSGTSATRPPALLPWDVIGAITLGAGLLMLGNWWYFRSASTPAISQSAVMALSTPATTLPTLTATKLQRWRSDTTVAGAPATVQLVTTAELPSSIQIEITPAAPSSQELATLAQGKEPPAWIRRIDLDNVGLVSTPDGKFKGSGRARISVQSLSVSRVVATIHLEGSWDQRQNTLNLTLRTKEQSRPPGAAEMKLSPLIQGRYQVALSDSINAVLTELPSVK